MLKKAKAAKHAIMAAANKNATTMMITPIKTSPFRIRKIRTPPRTITENLRIHQTVVGAIVAIVANVAIVVIVANVAIVVIAEIVVIVMIVANVVVEKVAAESVVAIEEVVESEADEAVEVQQGDTTMTSMCSRASVPEIS